MLPVAAMLRGLASLNAFAASMPLCAPIAIAALVIGLGLAACSSSDSSGPEPDTDGDGLSDAEELNVYGTSPVSADTDGDGLSDYEEVVTYAFDPTDDPTRFNPRVTDAPQMNVEIVGPPVLTFQTNDQSGVTDTQTYSWSDAITQSDSPSETDTAQRTDTQSSSVTYTHEISVTQPLGGSGSGGSGGASGGGSSGGADGGGAVDAGVDSASDSGTGDEDDDEDDQDSSVDAGADSAADSVVPDAAAEDAGGGGGDQGSGATLTLTDSVATTINPSTSFSTSIALTDTKMISETKTVNPSESVSGARTITALGAVLKIPTIVQNRSNLAFKVTNIALSAVFIDRAGPVIAVQNMILDEGILSTFQPFTLAPGEQTGIAIFTTVPLTLETGQAILDRAGSLVIRLSTYELDNADGKAYAFDTPSIGAKTALLAIDYGGERPAELYQVATNLNPAHPGVTAAKVFDDILRIPYAIDKDAGLTSVRSYSVKTSGGPHWSVAWLRKQGPDTVAMPSGANGTLDFSQIELRAGDVLHVALVKSNARASSSAGPAGTVPPPSQGTGPDIDGGLKVTRP